MAALLLLIAALGATEPAVAPAAEPPTSAALFDAAASCTAYHIYVAATATPQSDEARSAEDKATMFLLAAYARMPDEDRGAAEARIEDKVKGLFEDSASVAPEQHGKEMAELKQVCAEFEPAATAIAEQAAASPKPE